MSKEDKNSNIKNPFLTIEAIDEVIEILSTQMNVSLHLSKYPQDRWKNEIEAPDISILTSTAKFHDYRWKEIKSVIDYLTNIKQEINK